MVTSLLLLLLSAALLFVSAALLFAELLNAVLQAPVPETSKA